MKAASEPTLTSEAKSHPKRERLDLYDPHFPIRRPAKVSSGGARAEIYAPHFPPRVRN